MISDLGHLALQPEISHLPNLVGKNKMVVIAEVGSRTR